MQSPQGYPQYYAGPQAMDVIEWKESAEHFYQQTVAPYKPTNPHRPDPRIHQPALPFSSLRNVSTIAPISDEADLTEQESSSSASGSSQDAEGSDSDISAQTETEDEEDASPALGRTFTGHAAFERYAVGLLQASHENAVVERKRNKNGATLGCRNRRGANAKVPGTNCTWLLRASQISDTKWQITEICMKHNKACWQRMENIIDGEVEEEPASSVMEKDQNKKASPPRLAYKKRILPAESEDEENVEEAGKEAPEEEEDDDESESEPETPWELRKRKANHPGNQLPSRARRYKF